MKYMLVLCSDVSREGEVTQDDAMSGCGLIECADLDEAIEVASKHPWARVGQIEVRPVREP